MNSGNIRFWDLCGGGNGGCFLVLTVETGSGRKFDAFASKVGSFCGKFEENWGIGRVQFTPHLGNSLMVGLVLREREREK